MVICFTVCILSFSLSVHSQMDIWLCEQCWTRIRASIPWWGWKWERDFQELGELLQPIRCLSCKHEGLCSDGQHSCEIWACGMSAPLCWESKAGGCTCGLAVRSVKPKAPRVTHRLGLNKSKTTVVSDAGRHPKTLLVTRYASVRHANPHIYNTWLHPNWKCKGILTKK